MPLSEVEIFVALYINRQLSTELLFNCIMYNQELHLFWGGLGGVEVRKKQCGWGLCSSLQLVCLAYY